MRECRMVMLQFSFSNIDAVPKVIRRLPAETIEERIARKSYPGSGAMVIVPTERCSLVEFLGELELAGYELVDASYKECINDGTHYKKTHHKARFIFVHREFVELSDDCRRIVRGHILAELKEICEGTLWRIRAFSNPFYKNGLEVPGQCALSINLEARVPLFCPDGQPVTAWQKDENGNRIGSAPLPLQPNYHLSIVEGNVSLVADP